MNLIVLMLKKMFSTVAGLHIKEPKPIPNVMLSFIDL